MRRWILMLLAPGLVAFGIFSMAAAASDGSELTLNLNGLEPLPFGHYEGWAIFGSEKVSTGKFGLASDGSLVALDGKPAGVFTADRDLTAADTIVITIEPEGDVDVVPSGIVVLAGPITGSTAALSFPIDLTSIAGGYILATPTDADATNDVAGVWFLDPGGPATALTLPSLPAGWVYEGWGVTQGTPLTTGRFSTAAGADTQAPYSGPNAGPPFPGEDFVANLPASISGSVNLADGASTIVLSVEPDLAGVDPTGVKPFSIKPLAGPVPSGLADHLLTALAPNFGTVPSGSATLTIGQVTAPSAGNAGIFAESDGGSTSRAALLVVSALALATTALALFVRSRGGRRAGDTR